MKTRAILGTTLALTLITGLASATPQGRVQPEQKPAGPGISLTAKEFPDGTGTISLPTGWSIEGSYRGSVGINGPNSQKGLLGMSFIIGRPDHPVHQQGIPFSGPLRRDGDLAGALQAVLASNGIRLISLRTREMTSPQPGVPAALFLGELEYKGKRMAALGYFSAIIDTTQTLSYWELYSSMIMTPKETFVQEFPTLVAIWDSYRSNGKKPKEGSNGAMIDAAIAENLKTRKDTLKSQQEAFDRMNERFKSVIQQ